MSRPQEDQCGDPDCTEEHGDQTTPNSAEELFEDLYVCKDPDCTATHVDMDKVETTGVFIEQPDFALYEQSLHSMNERMRKR